MAQNEQMFAIYLTPEMIERLTKLNQDVLRLIQERIKRPEEAFIVLDAVRRELEVTYDMVLMAPVDPGYLPQS